jgi:hypothetical protein
MKRKTDVSLLLSLGLLISGIVTIGIYGSFSGLAGWIGLVLSVIGASLFIILVLAHLMEPKE